MNAKIKCLEVCKKVCFPKLTLKVDYTYGTVDLTRFFCYFYW